MHMLDYVRKLPFPMFVKADFMFLKINVCSLHVLFLFIFYVSKI